MPYKQTTLQIPIDVYARCQQLAMQYETTVSAILRLSLALGVDKVPDYYRSLSRKKAAALPTVRESLERMKRGENPLPLRSALGIEPATPDTFDELQGP